MLDIAPLSEPVPLDLVFEEERSAVADAVAERRNAFLWGRVLLRRQADRLGVALEAVGIDRCKAPILPANLSASISHDGDYVLVAVARLSHCRAIGVDIEAGRPLMTRLRSSLFTSKEHYFCSRWAGAADPYKIMFSAKESLYKCYYCLTGERLVFKDVSIILNDCCSLSAVSERAGCRQALLDNMRGFYWLGAGKIVTAFIYPRV